MADDFSTEVEHALDATPEPMDREWASETIEITYQVAPYTPIMIRKAGGVTVHYALDTDPDQRAAILQATKGDLRERLQAEAWEDMRKHVAEYKALVRELAESSEFDQREFSDRAQGAGRPAAQQTDIQPRAAAQRPPAPQPSTPKAKPQAVSGPRDWGFLKRAVKASDLGHEDRYAVCVSEYTYDGSTLACFATGSQYPAATMKLVRDDEDQPNFFWKRVWGEWEPKQHNDKSRGKLSTSYVVLLIEASVSGKATSKGNPYANLVGRLEALPNGLDANKLPLPENAMPDPLDQGALASYFNAAEDTGDDYPSDDEDERYPF